MTLLQGWMLHVCFGKGSILHFGVLFEGSLLFSAFWVRNLFPKQKMPSDAQSHMRTTWVLPNFLPTPCLPAHEVSVNRALARDILCHTSHGPNLFCGSYFVFLLQGLVLAHLPQQATSKQGRPMEIEMINIYRKFTK